MINQFQNTKFLKSLYKDKDLISFRGNFFKEYSNRKYSLRSFILRILPKLKQKMVLDIGCGDCSFLEKLNENYPDNKYFGLDITENKKCSDRKYIEYKIYDGKFFPNYKNKFDFIFCMHILYHVKDFDYFFSKVREYLKFRGNVVITTKSKFTLPHIESLFSKIVNNLNLKQHASINNFRDESRFCLENGLIILKKYFPEKYFVIDECVMETQIIVDNQKDLLKYIFSTDRYNLKEKINNDNIIKKYSEAWKKEISNSKIFIDKYVEVVYFIKNI